MFGDIFKTPTPLSPQYQILLGSWLCPALSKMRGVGVPEVYTQTSHYNRSGAQSRTQETHPYPIPMYVNSV